MRSILYRGFNSGPISAILRRGLQASSVNVYRTIIAVDSKFNQAGNYSIIENYSDVGEPFTIEADTGEELSGCESPKIIYVIDGSTVRTVNGIISGTKIQASIPGTQNTIPGILIGRAAIRFTGEDGDALGNPFKIYVRPVF